jgi:hypothetical protein
MRSLGIDLAAEPPNTAACEITWTAQRAHARLYADRLDDGRLLTLIETADKVGIDCPFGWPLPFVSAVAIHANAAAWPGRGQLGSSHRQSLRYRLTDKVVHQQVGIWPLSVSTDRIGVTAMRCAALLDALAAAGHPVDRAGGGRGRGGLSSCRLKALGTPPPGLQEAGRSHRPSPGARSATRQASHADPGRGRPGSLPAQRRRL